MKSELTGKAFEQLNDRFLRAIDRVEELKKELEQEKGNSKLLYDVLVKSYLHKKTLLQHVRKINICKTATVGAYYLKQLANMNDFETVKLYVDSVIEKHIAKTLKDKGRNND